MSMAEPVWITDRAGNPTRLLTPIAKVAMQPIREFERIQEIDYIIIGSGAAGSILAGALASVDYRLLVIEAGPTACSPNLKVPSRYPFAFGSRWDWCHRTVPQTGLASRRIPLPSGKMLGGSTGINAMIFIEPASDLWDHWAATAGARWSQSEIAPCLDRFRDWLSAASHTMGKPSVDEGAQMESLPSTPPLSPWMDAVLGAAKRDGWTAMQLAGSPSESRGFGKAMPGIDRYRRMQRRGRRVSAWNLASQLQSSSQLRSGYVYSLPNTTAHRILFDQQRAIGAAVQSLDGESIDLFAKRGVIVCAGALHTPKLLLQSGIGPRDWLESLRLDVRRESPHLGGNLQDHLVFPIVYESRMATTDDGGGIVGQRRRNDRLQYVRHRSGPLASNLAELGAFVDCGQPSSQRVQASATPDFQWHITPTHYLEYPNGKSEQGAISIGLTHMRPLSRGRMHLDFDAIASARDGEVHLQIDPRYLHASEEIEAWTRAIGWARQFFEGDAWREVLGPEVLPGRKRATADALELALRRLASTLYHYCGTCSMGTDQDATLDPAMRVRGFEQLWVCDASAMPVIPNCNPQATIMMMAHRLACELIDGRA